MNARRALASRRKESITAMSTRSMELKRSSAAVRGVRDAAAKPLRKKKVDLDKAVVKKDVIIAWVMCNICKNTMQEVTTISECLHSFCRKCIFDAAPASCPECGVDLGTRPLEKLKPDPTLDTLVKYFNSLLTTGGRGGRASSGKVEIATAKDAAATTKKNHKDPACNCIADDEEAAVARAEEEEEEEEEQEVLLLTCPKCKQPLEEEEEEPTSITSGDHELICRRCTAFRAAAATVWPLCNVNLQRIMSPRRKMQLLDQPELSSFDSLLNSKVAGAPASSSSKEIGAVTSGPAAAAKNRHTRKAAETTTAPSAWTPASKRKRLSLKPLAKKNNAATRPATTGSLHSIDFAETSHAAADPPKAEYLNCILNKCAHEEEDFQHELPSIRSRRSLRIWTDDNNNSVKLQMRRRVPPAVLQPPPQIAVAVPNHDPIDLSLSLGQGRLDLHVPAATEYNAADAADQQQGMKNQQQIWVHLQPATRTTTTKLVQLKLTNDDAATATGAAPAAPPPHDQELPPLDSPYLRIKDADMPVSVLKSYLMRKLSLNPEEEDVDILQCHNSNNMIPVQLPMSRCSNNNSHATDDDLAEHDHDIDHLPLKALSFQWFSAQRAITDPAAAAAVAGDTHSHPFVLTDDHTHDDVLLWDKVPESFGDLPETVQPKDLVALLSYKRKPLSLAALKTQSQLPT